MMLRVLWSSCRLRPAAGAGAGLLVPRRVAPAPLVPARRSGHYIPPSQYDIPLSRKFHAAYVLTVYWETIPLFVSTVAAILLVVVAIAWACKNKVDVVFTTHSCNNISRTMDLRNPTVHKVMIINQRYEPWPEMQDVLDKMAAAERRQLLKAATCTLIQ